MKKSGKPLSSQLFGVGQQSFSKKRLWRQINGKFARYVIRICEINILLGNSMNYLGKRR